MAAAGVGEQLGEKISVRGKIPEVMMRIDDRQVRLQDLLARLGEPILADA